jgi:DNA-binding MarR family transcriptional regulator
MVEPTDSLTLDQQVCYALSIAARGVVAVYKPLLEPLGLTHPQYLVMVALWQHGPQHVKELGALLALDSGTLSPLLKRLDSMGLVTRQRSAHDERQVTVSLTQSGMRLRDEAEKVQEQVVRRLGLDEPELEHLRDVLKRVTESVALASG